MTVLLDDQPLQVDDLGPEATVAQFVEVAKRRIEGSGSVIIALRRQGQDVAAEELEQMLTEPASGHEKLEIISGRPEQVVLEALERVREAFADTFADVKEAAEALVGGRVSETMAILGRCVGVWAEAHTAVIQGGALAGVDFDGLQIVDRPISEWLGRLTVMLHDLKTAIESHDTVLLQDILNYELDEPLREWERMLDGFIAHIRQLGDKAAAPAESAS